MAWLFWFLELVSLTSLAITARLSGSRESLGLPIDQSGSRKDSKAQSPTYPHGNFLDDRLGPGILRDGDELLMSLRMHDGKDLGI